jgi:hypothetical protein
MCPISQSASNNHENGSNTLVSHSKENPLIEDPWLNTALLCRAMTDHFGGRKICRDSIRKAVKMGLPHQINRLNGRKEFQLTVVLSWWIKSPLAKAS